MGRLHLYRPGSKIYLTLTKNPGDGFDNSPTGPYSDTFPSTTVVVKFYAIVVKCEQAQ